MTPEEQAAIDAVTAKLTGEKYLLYGTKIDGSIGLFDDGGDAYTPYYVVGAITGRTYGPFSFMRDAVEECIRRGAQALP